MNELINAVQTLLRVNQAMLSDSTNLIERETRFDLIFAIHIVEKLIKNEKELHD